MAKALTDVALKALLANPPTERVEIKDGTVDGLTLRVGPRGRPTWAFRFRVRGAGGTTARGAQINGSRYHRISLGTYPALSLKAARAKAGGYSEAIERGENPIDALEENAVDRKDTVVALISDYLTHAERALKSWRNARWTLHRHVIPRWGDLPAGTIRERDARALVSEVQKGIPDNGREGAKPRNGAAAEVRKWGSMLFTWGQKNGRVKLNPFREVPVPKLGQRQRFLTMDEARAVWTASADLREPWRQAIRLLMLTGCRENEVCAARWQWFDPQERTLLIPPQHYKSGRNFLVTLSTEAVRVIETLPVWNGGVFMLSTTSGEKPVAGVARKVIDDLHARAEAILGRRMERFALHDLRRTVRTHLSRLGVDDIVGELVLGHALKGLQARYNVYGYVEEKRAALSLWAAELCKGDGRDADRARHA